MRALQRRDRRRESQKAFARHDMRSSAPRSAAQCNRLDLHTDSEHSSGKVDSGDLGYRTNSPTTHFYGKYSAAPLPPAFIFPNSVPGFYWFPEIDWAFVAKVF